jgi:cytochrome oxidase Cu insertion factor (SCO1/SenC/PrrC family)
MRRTLVFAACTALVCAGCTSSAPELPDLGPVGDFQLMERGGRTITQADLQGKVWVASFVFTRCTGPCPQVTGTMARLQSQLPKRDDVKLVTITVDPDRDQLEDLRAYADHFRADRDRWYFLTATRDVIDSLCIHGFGVGVDRSTGKDVPPGQEVTHSTKLVLVDRHGHKRGYFDGRQVDDAGQPVDELPKLLPAVDALLRERS